MVKRIYENDRNKRSDRKLRERFEDYDKQTIYDCVNEIESYLDMIGSHELSVTDVEKEDEFNGKVWLETDVISTDNYGDIVAKIRVDIYNGDLYNWDIYDISSDDDIVQAVVDARNRPATADMYKVYETSLGSGMYDSIGEYLINHGVLGYNDDGEFYFD